MSNIKPGTYYTAIGKYILEEECCTPICTIDEEHHYKMKTVEGGYCIVPESHIIDEEEYAVSTDVTTNLVRKPLKRKYTRKVKKEKDIT